MSNLNAQFVKVLAPWSQEPRLLLYLWITSFCYIFGLPASAISLDYQLLLYLWITTFCYIFGLPASAISLDYQIQ
jgi:hypothetical protein